MTSKAAKIDTTPQKLAQDAQAQIEDQSPELIADVFERLERRRRWYANAAKQDRATYYDRSMVDALDALAKLHGLMDRFAAAAETMLRQRDELRGDVGRLTEICDRLAMDVSRLQTEHTIASGERLKALGEVHKRLDKQRDMLMEHMAEGNDVAHRD